MKISTIIGKLSLLALLFAPLCVRAERFFDDDFDYAFCGDSDVRVCGIKNSSAKSLTVPNTVEYEYYDWNDWDVKHKTCTVKSIGGIWSDNLESIVIPNGVMLGRYAFGDHCPNLKNVTIKGALDIIPEAAFSGAHWKTLQSPMAQQL